MKLSVSEIKRFRQLRRNLEPILKESEMEVLNMVDRALGEGFQLPPQPKSKKRLSKKDLINQYLIPNGCK